jgi:hypothetical protein
MEHICIKCNKNYSSYQSLWIHNKKYHKLPPVQLTTDSALYPPETAETYNIPPTIHCSYCKITFTRKDSLKKHYNICKVKLSNDNKIQKENELLKEQLKETEEVVLNMEKQFKEQMENMKKHFTELINKQCKIHPKTLTKINKQLNTQINNDNKVINNNIIIQLGREKIYEVFSKKEKIDVLNHGYMCLENLIEKAHFNSKYPQFKNILITNLQNNIAYKYNSTTNNFDVVTKKELLEDIISERMYDIEDFFNNHKDDISSKMQTVIEAFIKKMDNESYEENKKQNIKIILYNNREKVKRDIEIEV